MCVQHGDVLIIKRHRKLDHINRKHYASINVCAIVDMHGVVYVCWR
jgi:hypothetical protein